MTKRIAIDDVSPVISGGRHPGKAVVGEQISVAATVWREGHEAVAASVVWRGPGDRRPRIGRMTAEEPEADRWTAHITPDHPGMWTFRVDGWGDPWLTWLHAVEAKVSAGQNADELALDLWAGAILLDRAARSREGDARRILRAAAGALGDTTRELAERLAAVDPRIRAMMAEAAPREPVTRGETYRIWVDRERALFGAWYEFFPRSTGGRDRNGKPVHGTFATAAGQLERVAAMGFDVVYLPPIHPIGVVHRKGRNNTVTAEPGDVGSPWAIGSAAGGHDAVHPALGTMADFDEFVVKARAAGLEVALDLALQCAPDHPWVREHPQWFTKRADGSIAYAENPPKKYQDIYPLNFDKDPEGIRAEILRVVLHWVAHGVTIFRVDNPHTKPPDFWHWLIWTVKKDHPHVLFLAEAFTRPARLYGLAKLGFSQSYTYFTWRDSRGELADFAAELVRHADVLRPNLFVNTPDILPLGLQGGQPAMFALRAALAATLAPSWGVYAGFELFEHEALVAGGEEYRDSEKFELRPRDFEAAEAAGRSLQGWLTRLNAIRRAHPALRVLRSLAVHPTSNPALIAYSKSDLAREDVVLVVVNLDPSRAQEGTVSWRMDALGLSDGAYFPVYDEVSGQLFEWTDETYIKLDPQIAVAHIAGRR
jgi:starch synthase (maltosyl-transferring)